jgi:hypothetical protein
MEADTVTELSKLKRRATRARNAAGVTCSASRHMHEVALAMAVGAPVHDLPQVARSLLAVLEALWIARAELARMKGEAL